MFYREVQLVPVQLQTVATFAAADPWNGEAPADWTLSVYRMVAERYLYLYPDYASQKQTERADGRNLDRDDVLGLRSSADGSYHILPIALMQLWQGDRLPDRAVPRLIFTMEPSLRRSDFHAPEHERLGPRVLAVFVGLLGLLFFLPGLYAFLASLPEFSGGALIMFGFAAIFLGYAGWTFWQWRQHRRRIADQKEEALRLL